MSHSYTNPDLPLSSGDKVVSSGQVLASGEGNYFDFVQHHENNNGSGINHVFPSPADFVSGVVETYDRDGHDPNAVSGIFNWDGLRQSRDFSNSPNEAPTVPEVTFNPYIHYLPNHPDHESPENDVEDRQPVEIPYLSDVNRTTSKVRPPYQYSDDGLFSYTKLFVEDIQGSGS